MTGRRTRSTVALACAVAILTAAPAIAQFAGFAPAASNGIAAAAQGGPRRQSASVLTPAPAASTFGVTGAVFGQGARPSRTPPMRKLATDRGASYAAPPAPAPPGLVVPRPAARGQSSVASDRVPSSVFTATPLVPRSNAARVIGDVPALTEVSRLNPRLGPNLVKLAAGRRLGGGYDIPSREAVTRDPRDLFDYRVRALEDPAQRPR